MDDTRAFAPLYRAQVMNPAAAGSLLPSTTIAATDAAGSTTQFSGNLTGNTAIQMRVSNLSSSWAYVNFGPFGNITTATVAASYPIAPNSVEVVTVDDEVSGASVILGTPAATGNVIFTRGIGI